jgi:hypothetical protein
VATGGPTSVPTVTAPAAPPANVESRFLGRLSFEDGYPTEETIKHLYDELDFQRGTQVALRNTPALSMYNLRLALARDLGVDASNKLAIFRATACGKGKQLDQDSSRHRVVRAVPPIRSFATVVRSHLDAG